jgi:hypothetical protein
MNLTKDKVTEIFYLVDEFCMAFEASTGHSGAIDHIVPE